MQLRSLIAKIPYPSAAVQQIVAIAAIVAQGGIGVTGSVVRVTGSGLGCPTWPQCVSGSMFPVEHPEFAALNQWIEFGNRLLTGIVVIVAAACVLTAWRIYIDRPQRKRLLLLAWTMPAGVFAQALIGGVTVLTDLLWWTVAIHFLVSATLVWLAVLLWQAFSEGDGPARWLTPRSGRITLVSLTALLGLTLIAGTTVTGAGPHGGDPDTPRFAAPIEKLAHIHGALVIIYVVALAIFGAQLRRARVAAPLWRRYGWLCALTLAQAGVGSAQFALGIPEELVSLHVLGAMAVIAAAAAVWCGSRARETMDGANASDDRSAPLATVA